MMNKDGKIYVAGHRGMVGSAIVRSLERNGYHNIITRTHKELDLTRQDQVEKFFAEEKPDYVFLAAAKVGGIVANSEALADFMYDNMILEMNVIHEAWKNNCKKLLFLGSSCIYPRMAPQPMKENCLLTSELEKTNEAYALAKISGLKYCEFLNRMGEVTLQRMKEAFGTRPSDVWTAIGPSICQDCYEVSEDVAQEFISAFEGWADNRLLYRKENGKYQLNLWRANELVLLESGVPKDRIAVTDICTCCNPQVLFSHRASKGKRGNLGAFLQLLS